MGGAYAEGRPPGPWKEGRSLDVQTRVGGLPGGRPEQNLVFRSKQRVPGPWRESEKTDVGSVLIAWMSPAYARTGHSRPCLGIALVTEAEKEWPAGLPSPLPMPCKQAQPGCRPRPDRSCLALGSEVARKAGRARLSDSQGFPSWPGGRQPGRRQPATACPAALESRQLLRGTIGQKGGWGGQGTRARRMLSKVKVQFGTGLYYRFKVHPSSQGVTTPAEEARLAQGKLAFKDSKCPAPWQGSSLACVFIPEPRNLTPTRVFFLHIWTPACLWGKSPKLS